MLVHSQFEAWWVGVGSIILPLFLMFLFMLMLSDKNNTVISAKGIPSEERGTIEKS
jgi:hypothetical protein